MVTTLNLANHDINFFHQFLNLALSQVIRKLCVSWWDKDKGVDCATAPQAMLLSLAECNDCDTTPSEIISYFLQSKQKLKSATMNIAHKKKQESDQNQRQNLND